MTNRIYSFLLAVLLIGISHTSLLAQIDFSTPDEGFFGSVEFSGFGMGASVTGVLVNFSDQTSFGLNLQSIDTGFVVVDQAGTIWQITQVNGSPTLFSANVDMDRVHNTGSTPFGVGYIGKLTPCGNIPFATTNSVGISPKVQAEIENYNWYKIADCFTSGSSTDTLTVSNNDESVTGKAVHLTFNNSQVAISNDTAYVTPNDPELDTVTVSNSSESVIGKALHLTFNDSEVAISNDTAYITPNMSEIVYPYDSGLGFWAFATPSITSSSGAAGIYDISIPDSSIVESIQVEFDQASDFTGSGEVVLNIDWNTSNFNTSTANAIYPTIWIIAPNGVQFNPQDAGVTVDHTGVASGETNTTLANISGVGTPVTIKIDF